MSTTPRHRLSLQSSNYFRQRLTLSLLSSRPLLITHIRSDSLNVGLRPHELSFLQLLNQLSNGSLVKISETGTELRFTPGVLTGGRLEVEVDVSRPLSYYLEPLLILAPFCKTKLELVLRGRLQNKGGHGSVYRIKYSGLGLLGLFGVRAEMEVLSRSSALSTIRFTSTIRRQLTTLRQQLSSAGPVQRIRGLAYGFRVGPQLLNRIAVQAKGQFIKHLQDVYITTDQVKRSKSTTAGYGLVLAATTTKGVCYSEDGWVGGEEEQEEDETRTTADQKLGVKRKFDLFGEEVVAKKLRPGNFDAKVETFGQEQPPQPLQPDSPESLADFVSRSLLTQIRSRSTVDSSFQWLVLALMALSPRDVSSVLLGRLTPFTVQYLRDLRTYFGVTFKVEELEGMVQCSCLGSGYVNLNKTMV